MKSYRLVLLRHGKSIWNKSNRFTGWVDVKLSKKGKAEARRAGRILREEGYSFNLAYTSVLKRAIKTLWLVLQEMDLMWIPVHRSWRLNERHYGALQGLNKAKTAHERGQKQVFLWRRSFRERPPALPKNDPRFPGYDKIYKEINPQQLPATESLEDTLNRLLPYWKQSIVLDIKKDKKVLIVAHGNSLRAIIKMLARLNEEEMIRLSIPTGIPLVYELDQGLKVIKHYYLGKPEEIKKAFADMTLKTHGYDS